MLRLVLAITCPSISVVYQKNGEVILDKNVDILATHKQRNSLSKEQVKAIRQVVINAEAKLGVLGFLKKQKSQAFYRRCTLLNICP